MKRYRVETLISTSSTWESVYETDSLPVARRYAASLRNPRGIPMTRVVDQRTEQVVYHDPPDARPVRGADRYRTLYVGVTNNLERRMWEHKQKVGSKFAAKYNITRLVHYEEFADIRDAIAREKQLKRWRRDKKVWLIERENPEWKDLSQRWYDGPVISSECALRARANLKRYRAAVLKTACEGRLLPEETVGAIRESPESGIARVVIACPCQGCRYGIQSPETPLPLRPWSGRASRPVEREPVTVHSG